MRLGIDVGGTFTDAVLIDGHRMVAWGKSRTTDNVMDGILAALDQVLQQQTTPAIEQVTLSTTIITNTIVSHREAPVDLYIVPGPGRSIVGNVPVEPHILDGYTDHRGYVVSPTTLEAITPHSKLAAVSAKFGVRNAQAERKLVKQLEEYETISLGSAMSGALHFERRTNTAYFNSAVTPAFHIFAKQVAEALMKRHITAPVYMLKADGGALPLTAMGERPVEAIFTGPAATVLGLEALQAIPTGDVVALDIGGTTTDISLWRNQQPIASRHGVTIRSYKTSVPSFAIHSVGIGGESAVRIVNGQITVGPDRIGPAVALGGTVPTLGDALVTAGYAQYGDVTKATQAIQTLADDLAQDVQDVCKQIVQIATEIIEDAMVTMITDENTQPVYRVDDVVHSHPFNPTHIVLVGGTAQALMTPLEHTLGLPTSVPKAAPVANAVGAAVAMGGIRITVRVDTKRKIMEIPELGITVQHVPYRELAQVVQEANTYVQREAERWGLPLVEPQVIWSEVVPVVDGWHSIERLITVEVALPVGVMTNVTA